MIAEIIPKVMEMIQRKNETYRPRCSNLGTEKCIRAQVYSALKYPYTPIPGRGIEVMDDSSWHEELTIDRLEKSAFKIHSRQLGVDAIDLKCVLLDKEYHCKICNKTIPKYTIHGHIDGILQDMQGDDYLFEHKAVSHFSFIAYETGDLYPIDYITQCTAYILGLKKLTGKLLPGIMVVKNKNTSKYMEFRIEYDEQEDIAKVNIFRLDYTKNNEGILKEVKEVFLGDIIKNAITRVMDIENYVIKKTLPVRQYDVDTWQCDYCRYNQECYKNYEKEIDNRKNEISVNNLEIVKMAAEYHDLNDIKKENEKKVDEIKTKLKLWMQEQNAKTGKAGKLIIKLDKRIKKSLDKALLPVELVNSATKRTPFEVLTVKKLGEVSDDK
jgi:hypothetical protein